MTHRRIVFAFYAASGAAALIYQVVWVRLFGLALGHTVASSSIVLAAFMCGLAGGAAMTGRLRLTPARSLQLYAALEVCIGAIALVLPAALALAQPLLSQAYADGDASGRFIVIRAMLSFALLGLPAAAMGATFPLVVASLSQSEDGAGRLYVTNTAGAAAGAIAAGFWLIPSFGMRMTTWAAVTLNLLSAAMAFWLSRVDGRPRIRPRQRGASDDNRAPIDRHAWWPALAATAAGLSGFAALVFEVAWTRLIALIIGPSTYAFAIMAASFIVGISVGSAFGLGRKWRTMAGRALWLCALLALSAAATLAAAWVAAIKLPMSIAYDVNATPAFHSLLVREALTLGLALITASAGFGAIFTLALALASPATGDSAASAARVYVLNTLGAVTGALAAGFVLLPGFGLEATFVLTSRLLIGTAAALALVCALRLPTARRSASRIAIGAAALLVATFWLPRWDRDLLSSGLYKYSRGATAEEIEIGARAGRLEYYKEGAAGTVSVKLLAGTRSLAIDGKVDASNGGDMLTQRLLGVLPMLAHENPQTGLVIGLGSGVTAAAAIATGDLQRLDVVEISPEVVDASSLFTPENGGLLRNRAVRLLVGDGRTHLQLTSSHYDVIVSEPSNPWMAGVAALFTREFFEAVRQRLTPEGVFCQWTHTYELDANDLRSIVATFASVFPNATMWLAGDGDLLLVGGRSDRDVILQNVERRARTARVQPLVDQGVSEASTSFFLMSMYAGGRREIASFAGQSALQDDDRMQLEFSAARAMYAPPAGNIALLKSVAGNSSTVEPKRTALINAGVIDWTNRGDVALRAEAFEMARESYRRAAELDGRSVEALRGAASAAAALGQLDEEIRWLRSRSEAPAHQPAATVALSSALAMNGELEAAGAALMAASRIDSLDPASLEQLASVAADLGDVARLGQAAETLMSRFPERADGRYYKAALLFMTGRPVQAGAETDLLLDRHPEHAKGRNLRGILCAASRNFSCARSAFEASLRANPRDASVYTNLGNVYLEMGDEAGAIRYFREAVAIDPGATAAKEALRAIAQQ